MMLEDDNDVMLRACVRKQVGHREQVLEGSGWKMLPGLFPTGKPLELDISYKVFQNVPVLPQQTLFPPRSPLHCYLQCIDAKMFIPSALSGVMFAAKPLLC